MHFGSLLFIFSGITYEYICHLCLLVNITYYSVDHFPHNTQGKEERRKGRKLHHTARYSPVNTHESQEYPRYGPQICRKILKFRSRQDDIGRPTIPLRLAVSANLDRETSPRPRQPPSRPQSPFACFTLTPPPPTPPDPTQASRHPRCRSDNPETTPPWPESAPARA